MVGRYEVDGRWRSIFNIGTGHRGVQHLQPFFLPFYFFFPHPFAAKLVESVWLVFTAAIMVGRGVQISTC